MIALVKEPAPTVPVRAWKRSGDCCEKAVLAERARVARELHDGLLQNAMTIALLLRAVLPDVRAASESQARALLPILELAEQTTADARRDIMGLRAEAVSESLDGAIEDAVRRSIAQTPLSVSMAIIGSVRPVPGRVHETLVRIVREAATNIARHARARRVRVTIAFGDRKLRVMIADDGKGFDRTSFDATRAHFGLLGMRERARAARGTLEIRTTPGLGSTVTVELPITPRMST